MSETKPMKLAEQARANYDKFVEDYKAEIPDIYDDLVKIIKDVSSKGAIGLKLCFNCEPECSNIELDEPEYYLNIMPHVYISTKANKGIARLIERLREDGFTVKTYEHTICGKTIDTISWVLQVA